MEESTAAQTWWVWRMVIIKMMVMIMIIMRMVLIMI